MLNKLFFLAAIKCDNPSIGIFWMRFDSRSCTESFKSIQVSYVLFLLHPFSLYDLRERVNFQRAYLYILLDVIPVFLYNKTERAIKTIRIMFLKYFIIDQHLFITYKIKGTISFLFFIRIISWPVL